VYFKRNAHFISDLRWDNADGHVPEVGSFRCVTPFGPRGNLTVDGTANDKLSTINTKAAHTRQKFIAYAGYLTNPFMLKRALQPPVLFFQTPIYFLGTKFPIFLGQEHAALRMLNRDISRVRVNPEGHSGSATSMPYLLNDGLVPVTSCLLLTPNAFEAFPAPRESDLPKLNSYLDVRLARVFRNVDHVSFADAKAPHLGSSHLEDAMHPDEKQRALLDWLLLDLLEASAQHNH
jgi:hypothetical protein